MEKIFKILCSIILCGSLFLIPSCSKKESTNSTDSSVNTSDKFQKDEQYEIYELAVSEGKFNGTYEQWLESIKGEDGKDGQPGKDGHDGKSAYEIYKESHPEYTKNEEEWLNDLVNGNLADKVIHTVNFDTDGGTIVDSQKVEHLNKVKKVETTKDGFLFDGWYIGDEKWVFAGYNVTEDITLKAHWIPNEFKVTINFDNGKPNQELIKQYNDELSLSEPLKQDYIFVGWEDSNGNMLEEPIIIKENMSIKAIYTNKINISFDTQGGNLIDPQEFIYNKNINSLPTPTMDDAIFDGWYYLDGNKEVMVELPFKCSFKEDVTLYAKWTPVYNNFLYEKGYNSYVITGYNGTEKNIVVPSKINNIPVDKIANDAFKNNTTIESVVIPNTVNTIGFYSFMGCINLKEVKLPDTINEFGLAAFSNCMSLKSINLPKSLTEIESDLFNGCQQLDNVIIPEGVRVINQSAFEGCINLKNIKLPSKITSISNSVFSNCSSLVTINLPKTLNSLGSYCFRDCTNLTDIVIPKGITTIEGGLFNGCTHLTNLTIEGNYTSIGGFAFMGCSSLKEFIIPNTVKSIGTFAFTDCTGIKKIIIPKSVESIGGCAFGSLGDPSLDIYCEAERKPVGFDESWANSVHSITWGYKPQ